MSKHFRVFWCMVGLLKLIDYNMLAVYNLTFAKSGLHSLSNSCSTCTTVRFSLLFNQAQLSLKRNYPGFIVVWPQFLYVLTHLFIAVIFKWLRKCKHLLVKLLFWLLYWSSSTCWCWFLLLLRQSTLRWSLARFLRFLLSYEFFFFNIFVFHSFGRLTSKERITRCCLTCNLCAISCAANFTICLRLASVAILILLLFFLFVLLGILCWAVWLHDIVN